MVHMLVIATPKRWAGARIIMLTVTVPALVSAKFKEGVLSVIVDRHASKESEAQIQKNGTRWNQFPGRGVENRHISCVTNFDSRTTYPSQPVSLILN